MVIDIALLISVIVGIVYWLILTGNKHNWPLHYENFIDKHIDNFFVKKVLPYQFCFLCFVTQSSLMVSGILLLLLAQPIWYIIILTPSATGLTIYLNNLLEKND
jgi:hypothetical protein